MMRLFRVPTHTMDFMNSGPADFNGDGTGDPVAAATGELSLRDRSNLILLDRTLHDHWELGRRVMLNWAAHPGGLRVLIVPYHALADYSGNSGGSNGNGAPAESFLQTLLSGLSSRSD